ncbi:hypothetical protein EJB05_31599, partial [Eragrostis curvula]
MVNGSVGRSRPGAQLRKSPVSVEGSSERESKTSKTLTSVPLLPPPPLSGDPDVDMVLAGEGDETGSPGRRSGRSGVGPGIDVGAGDGQNPGVEAGSKKRKSSVLSRNSNNLAGNGEGLEVECVDFLSISMEIETLRSQLDEDVKELKYCEENEKLRAEMDLKDKEMQCLRKQNEELHAKYEKQHEELQAKYKKRNEELRGKYENQNQKLEAKYEKKNEELQGKYEKQKQMLEAKYEKKNEELESMHKEKNKELQAKYEKQTEQLQAKHEGLQKNRLEMEVERLDTEIRIKMEKLGGMLERKRFSEKPGSAIVQKHVHTNAQGKLKSNLDDELKRETGLGFKRFGGLDEKPFLNVCKIRYGNDDYLTKAAELIKNWQEEVKNPNWHPFKMVKQADGVNKEVINDDDTKLKYLSIQFGDDVCNAVKTALMEGRPESDIHGNVAALDSPSDKCIVYAVTGVPEKLPFYP